MCEIVHTRIASPRDAVLSEELFQLSVLFGERLLVSTDVAEVLLQSEDFVLERFDVQLFPFSMSSILTSTMHRRCFVRYHIPLGLTI